MTDDFISTPATQLRKLDPLKRGFLTPRRQPLLPQQTALTPQQKPGATKEKRGALKRGFLTPTSATAPTPQPRTRALHSTPPHVRWSAGAEGQGGEGGQEGAERRKPWPKNMPADVRKGTHILSRGQNSPALEAEQRAEDREGGRQGMDEEVSRRGKRVTLTPGTVTPRPRTRRLLHTPRGLDAVGEGARNTAGRTEGNGYDDEEEVQAAAAAGASKGGKRVSLTPGTETPRERTRRLLATPVPVHSGRAYKEGGAGGGNLRVRSGFDAAGRGQREGGLMKDRLDGEEEDEEDDEEEEEEEDGDFDNDDLQALNERLAGLVCLVGVGLCFAFPHPGPSFSVFGVCASVLLCSYLCVHICVHICV